MSVKKLFKEYVHPVRMLLLAEYEKGLNVAGLARKGDTSYNVAAELLRDKRIFRLIKSGRGRGHGNVYELTSFGIVLVGLAKTLKVLFGEVEE